jgi:leucine dehydrogenase
MVIRSLDIPGYDRVLAIHDDSGYESVIALHSMLGECAFGGTRIRSYASAAEALQDVLRLAAAMTLKANAAGLPAGGGKAVILRKPGVPHETIIAKHAEVLNELAGAFVTAPDVGMSHDDVAALLQHTPYVTSCRGPAGEAAEHTARGTLRAIEAAVAHRLGRNDLAGMRVGVQGCGQVGSALARALAERGAQLFICDVDRARVAQISRETGAVVVSPDDILSVEANVFAPCALGAILNESTIPRIGAAVIAGAANNQLSSPEDEERLRRRRITYVPDHIASAGGLISGFGEYTGWTLDERVRRIDAIAVTTADALRREHVQL